MHTYIHTFFPSNRGGATLLFTAEAPGRIYVCVCVCARARFVHAYMYVRACVRV